MKIILLIASISFTTILSAQNLRVNARDLRDLYHQMAGEFSSEEQSIRDTTFFHVMLRMKPIRIPQQEGYWLYVEQSIAGSEDKPYRQRVYHLYIDDDTTIVSKVYEIKHPKQYVGGWNDDAKLAPIVMDSLIDRQGCGIYLHKVDKQIFSGSTPGKQCLSALRGAVYATSQVVIQPERIISWDRGWDKHDKQVWGSVNSGYIFTKIKNFKT